MCFISFRLALLSSTVSLLFDLFFIVVALTFCSFFCSRLLSLSHFLFHFISFSLLLFPRLLILFSTLFRSLLCVCVCVYIYAHSINSRSFSACLRKYQKRCMTSIKYTHIYVTLRHGTSANKLSLRRIAYKCLLNHGFWHNVFVLDVAFRALG